MKFITRAFVATAFFSLSGLAAAGGLTPPVVFLTAAPAPGDVEVHTSIEVTPGETFTVAVNYDFGPDLTSVGGASDFMWDANVLTLVGFEFGPDSGDPIFNVIPDTSMPGQLIQIGFGNFPSLPSAGIAAFLTFQANATEGVGGATEITGMETSGPFGGFPELDPTYDPLEVTVVPVPAAIWLLFGGLSALFGAARRRAIV